MTFVTDQDREASGATQPDLFHGNLKIDITPSSYFRWKGILGRILAALLLVPAVPIIVVLILLVRLTSKGPGIYRQMRVGRNGRNFKMYKIRTMENDAEAERGPEWTCQNDPRITPLGRVLRKLHLDEFPQLFNVLKGEMHLIGPRPERPEFTRVLAQEIPGYMNRLAVPPGITGLAQINLPPDTDLDSVRRKLVLDLEYIREANALLDLRMFASTLLRLLGFGGDFVMKLMKLQRDVPQLSKRDSNGKATDQRTPASIIRGDAAINGACVNGHGHAVPSPVVSKNGHTQRN